MNPEGGDWIKQTVEIIASAVRIIKDQVNKVMKCRITVDRVSLRTK
jgi:hypothetical protein